MSANNGICHRFTCFLSFHSNFECSVAYPWPFSSCAFPTGCLAGYVVVVHILKISCFPREHLIPPSDALQLSCFGQQLEAAVVHLLLWSCAESWKATLTSSAAVQDSEAVKIKAKKKLSSMYSTNKNIYIHHSMTSSQNLNLCEIIKDTIFFLKHNPPHKPRAGFGLIMCYVLAFLLVIYQASRKSVHSTKTQSRHIIPSKTTMCQLQWRDFIIIIF